MVANIHLLSEENTKPLEYLLCIFLVYFSVMFLVFQGNTKIRHKTYPEKLYFAKKHFELSNCIESVESKCVCTKLATDEL